MHPDIKTLTIPPSIPYRAIFARLGFSKNATRLSDNADKRYREIINSCASYCSLTGRYTRLPLTIINESKIKAGDHIDIASSDLARMLSGSNNIVFAAVSAGGEIVAYRDELLKSQPETAVIADAVGSELAEYAIRWLHDFIKKICEKEGLITSKGRYSPGYGDCPLSVQQHIHQLLRLDEIGITLSDSNIMIPEKSITAFIGITE